MNEECLDEATVLAFLGGALAPERRGVAEVHIARCSACMELTTWAAMDAANRTRKPGQERGPFIGQLEPGTRVGRYQILAPVGRGGMGEVYAAYHPDLDRRIALKVVHETDGGSAERRARLLREARAIARLSHPNVVAVHDAGTVSDRVFIAMEFVDGETIDAWLRREARSWRQILDVFIAAGRGLAAAHAAGIIHRDFKPQNVMVGKDGSVRVMDFGLARLVEDAGTAKTDDVSSPAESEGLHHTGLTVTRTGTLLGTLAYMAPEQSRGQPIDARADQFSFSVALYEALHGTRPAVPQPSAGTKSSPADAVEGLPGSRSPRWLRRVNAQALSERPEARYPSMAQLLKALERGRSRPIRRAMIAGATFLLVGTALGFWRLSHANMFDCSPPGDRIARGWALGDGGDPRRERIRGAFLSVRRNDGPELWRRFATSLDGYMGQWSDMYREACEATHARGEQSAQVLDLRMRCLDDNLDQVRALTDVLTSIDASSAISAMTAVSRLTPVSRCGDIPLLSSSVPLPRDQHTLDVVQELQKQLARAEALLQVGRADDALATIAPLRSQAEAAGYKPLIANLLDLSGRIWSDKVVPQRAEVDLHEALRAAEEGADDEAASRIASTLAYVVGAINGRHEEGLRWVHLSNAILVRAPGNHDLLRSWNLNNEAVICLEKGDPAKARRLFEQSVVIKERLLGRDHSDVGFGLSGLADAMRGMGDLQTALATQNEALDILENTLDPDSPRLAIIFINRGETLLEMGRITEATRSLTRALTLMEKVAVGGMLVSYPLTLLGRAALIEGHPDRAVSYLERALPIRSRDQPGTPHLAETQFALAAALWDNGGNRTRAVLFAREARAIYIAHERPRQVQEVDAWLATHRKRR